MALRLQPGEHLLPKTAVMGGVDIYTVKELMGHKDIKMTMRYAHLAPVKLQSGVDILDQSVTGSVATVLEESSKSFVM